MISPSRSPHPTCGAARSDRGSRDVIRLLVLLLALIVAGCFKGNDELPSFDLEVVASTPQRFEAKNSAGHRVIVDSEASYIELPFDRFVLLQFSAVGDRFDGAVDVLVNQCMEELGLDFRFDERPIRPWGSNHMRRYGIFSRDLAAQYGYARVPSPELDAIQERQSHPQSDEVQDALLGGSTATKDNVPIPEGGCMRFASDALGGPAVLGDPTFGLAQSVSAATLEMALEDKRVRAKVEEWLSCMADAGVEVAQEHPISLAASVGRSGSEVRGDEIDIAVADADCKESTRLLQVWAAVEAEIQSDFYVENEESLDRLNEALLELVEKSSAVLGVEVPDVDLLRRDAARSD